MKTLYFALTCILAIFSFFICSCGGGSDSSSPENGSSTELSTPLLSISSTTESSISLSWTDNNENEDGYELEISQDGISFNSLTSLASNSTSYTATGLENATTYYFRIYATTEETNSEYSSIVNSTTETIVQGSCSPLSGNNIYYVDTQSICGECSNDIEKESNTIETPWCDISESLDKISAGDTLVIKEGRYYETFSIPTGEPGLPITVKAFPNDNVIIDSSTQISGWELYQGNIYRTTISWKPLSLTESNAVKPISKMPDEGWWAIESVVNDDNDTGTDSITDTTNLSDAELDIIGAEIFLWTANGNTQATETVTGFNSSSATIELTKSSQWLVLNEEDRYWLQNHKSFINAPGEWAVEENGENYTVYFWPSNEGNLSNIRGVPSTSQVILINDAENVTIDGLRVENGSDMGINVYGSSNVTVTGSYLTNILRYGINVRDSENVIVSKNLVSENHYGIACNNSSNVTIEKNDIGYNSYDGLIITWGSTDITVYRNYIHHHYMWGHPDNIQTYRGVSNLLIKENFLLAGGQNIMMEETTNTEMTGNTIIGSNSMSVIFGHNNTTGNELYNNTIAYCRYGCLNLTEGDYLLDGNIFVAGDSDAVFSIRDIDDYTSDNNLFFLSEVGSDMIIHTDAGWSQTLEQYQLSEGQDLNSAFGNPLFANAPYYYTVTDTDKNHLFTTSSLILAYDDTGFEVGDTIEINFDGVARTVTALTEETISFTPELDSLDLREVLIANWKDQTNFQIDTTLDLSSPAYGIFETGAVGSTISIEDFQNGDFDGDGNRDIPSIAN